MVHKNHFFLLYQQNKSFASELKLKRDSNQSKIAPETYKTAYADKNNRVYHFPEAWLL